MPYIDINKKKEWERLHPKSPKQTHDYYMRHRARILESAREYRKRNRDRILEYNNTTERKTKNRFHHRKYDSTLKLYPKRLLKRRMAGSMRKAILGVVGSSQWENILGYSAVELKKHLERQFDKNMNWFNYGSYWHIDHIRPIASFNFKSMDDAEFKECYSITNLRPLEAKENILKRDKILYLC